VVQPGQAKLRETACRVNPGRRKREEREGEARQQTVDSRKQKLRAESSEQRGDE
jgi:hypothetical protein